MSNKRFILFFSIYTQVTAVVWLLSSNVGKRGSTVLGNALVCQKETKFIRNWKGLGPHKALLSRTGIASEAYCNLNYHFMSTRFLWCCMSYKNAFLFTLFCLYEGFRRAELCYPSMDPLHVCSSTINNVVKIYLIKKR